MALFFPLRYMNHFTTISRRVHMLPEYTLYFNGCCKGVSVGPGGCGAILYCNGTEICGKSLYVGPSTTKYITEYIGLIFGLEKALSIGLENLVVKGDSRLIVKQMFRKEYQLETDDLLPLFQKAKELTNQFSEISFRHVYLSENKRAVELANHGANMMIQ
jgi:ribonuclease HI